jgi:hypothetical protein
MSSVPNLDFASFVRDRELERKESSQAKGHDYAYVSDKTTRATFEKIKPIELAVASSVRLYKQVLRNQLLGNAVKVSFLALLHWSNSAPTPSTLKCRKSTSSIVP